MGNHKVSSLLEVVKNGMEDNIYNMTENGKCSRCGGCCSNLLPLSNKEIEVIKRYIKKKGIKEVKKVIPLSGSFIDMVCPFLNEQEKKCNIYSVRPKVCSSFICDNEIRCKMNREMFKDTRSIYDVRETFFGS